MQDFPPNSHKAREAAAAEEAAQRVERVTSGEAVRRKQGLGSKFKRTFINGDAKSAAQYMFMDVIAPAIQDTIVDALQGGIEKYLRGDSKARHRGTPTTYSPGRVAYNQMSRPGPPQPAQRVLNRRNRNSFDDIIIPTRQDAEEVLERMYDLLDRFGVARVADLYSATGIQGSHTDVKWGWTSLRGSRIVKMRSGGYLLDLPEPEPLDDRR